MSVPLIFTFALMFLRTITSTLTRPAFERYVICLNLRGDNTSSAATMALLPLPLSLVTTVRTMVITQIMEYGQLLGLLFTLPASEINVVMTETG